MPLLNDTHEGVRVYLLLGNFKDTRAHCFGLAIVVLENNEVNIKFEYDFIGI